MPEPIFATASPLPDIEPTPHRVEARTAAEVAYASLSAGDDDIARVYEGVGFVRVGTFADAEPRGDTEPV